MYVLIAVLVCIALSDFENRTIPNKLVLAGIANRVVFIVVSGIVAGVGAAGGTSTFTISTTTIMSQLGSAIVSGLALAGPLLVVSILLAKMTGRTAVGGGDIKLLFMVGLYFSPLENIALVFMACALGAVCGLASALSARQGPLREHTFPFGPSIAVAAWTVALFGDQLVGWWPGAF